MQKKIFINFYIIIQLYFYKRIYLFMAFSKLMALIFSNTKSYLFLVEVWLVEEVKQGTL